MKMKSEGPIVVSILALISFVTLMDLLNDFKEGGVWWHVGVELFVAIIAIIGVFLLVKNTFSLQKSLIEERGLSEKLREESEHWKNNSKKFIEGLSLSIEIQLDKWGLTKSEKEVAFFLIKGLSLKEISKYRLTTEKTIRTQATAIYSKSGLAGRSQLSAFFLEDLLAAQYR